MFYWALWGITELSTKTSLIKCLVMSKFQITLYTNLVTPDHFGTSERPF